MTEGTAEEYAVMDRAYGEGRLVKEMGLELGPAFNMWRATGCNACDNTGYKGRVPLHEILENDESMRKMIADKAPVHEIRAYAIAHGMHTLLQDGIEKCLTGATDLTQVLAVCSR